MLLILKQRRIKEEIGKDAKSYRAWWDSITEELKYWEIFCSCFTSFLKYQNNSRPSQ